MPDQSRASRLLLLTGAPGVGKTTLVRKVADALAGRKICGFLTEEIRDRGRRTGFRIETFDGDSATLAHVNIRSPSRVGRYGVDVDTMDRVAERALNLDQSAEFFLIDEIGKMESLSLKFVTAVKTLLDSDARLIATIPLKGGEFVRQVKQHPQAELWEINRENRESMAARVLAWIGLT